MPNTMRNILAVVIALLFAVAHTNAWAQPKTKDDKKDDKKKDGDEVELELEPEPPDLDGLPGGARENPDAPIIDGEQDRPVTKRRTRRGRSNYPIEVMHRPLTLFAGMSEVALDYPINMSPFAANGLLRASYGVTGNIELGLKYGIGTISKDGYLEGKTFSIEVGYKITEWASVRVSIPVLVDPFAMGLRISVPFRFKVMDKLALVGGHDLVSFRFAKFVPEVGNPAATAALVALDSIGTVLPRGDVRIMGGVIYQWKPKVAILADIGFIASSDDQEVPLHVGAIVSKSRRLDYGVRIGVERLDEVTNTFGIALFAAFRI